MLTLDAIREAPKALLHDHLDGGLRPAAGESRGGPTGLGDGRGAVAARGVDGTGEAVRGGSATHRPPPVPRGHPREGRGPPAAARSSRPGARAPASAAARTPTAAASARSSSTATPPSPARA